MPAPLQVTLSEESDRTLQELRVASTVAAHIRDRAHMVRLNAQGWSVAEIAGIFECQGQTVRLTLKRWEIGGLGGLWDAPGRGMKRRWNEADIEFLEQCLEQGQRTYTSAQLATKLEQERNVSLSADRVRRILKKRGTAGSAPATASANGKIQSFERTSKQTSGC